MKRMLQFLRTTLVGGLRFAVGLGSLALVLSSPAQTAARDESLPPATNAPSKFRSPEDGRLDLSAFIDKAYGFAPIVFPITEPAVGYGAAGGVAFIDKPKGEAQAGFGRPNVTAVGGMGTENGSWGVLAADSRYWLDDRLQTLVGVAHASVNLDFYGIGRDGILQNHPLRYNLQPLGGLVQVKYRLGHSRAWAGLSYALATTQVGFDAPAGTPGRPSFQRYSRVGGLTPSFTYDSRDTMFTPTRGTYFETTAGCFSQALGGDDEFQRGNLIAIHYLPLHPKLTLGLRGDVNLSFGEVPFYLRPSVSLRGAAAMRYQGEQVAQVEAELRWQFWQRFSLVGFVGSGAAWNNFERFEKTLTVVTGGTGFRYELARKYGLHMGVDVAFGPDAPVVYVQFGSAWMRP
jgi:outer membrane protein assembly factor BamA